MACFSLHQVSKGGLELRFRINELDDFLSPIMEYTDLTDGETENLEDLSMTCVRAKCSLTRLLELISDRKIWIGQRRADAGRVVPDLDKVNAIKRQHLASPRTIRRRQGPRLSIANCGVSDSRLKPNRASIRMLASNLIYAIGDVHGRLDLLTALLDFVAIDAERRHQEPKVIFLGDIIDRGPESKWCIELVASTLERWPRSRLILGNHDDWFLRVLGTDEPDATAVVVNKRPTMTPSIRN